MERIVPYEIRAALIEAIRKHARFAAEFECSAGNYDRPIRETPWLAPYRYGDSEYDARWYAVHSAKGHFNEGLEGAIEDALDRFERAAYTLGAVQQ